MIGQSSDENHSTSPVMQCLVIFKKIFPQPRDLTITRC
jgi:hypothetical protein